MGSLPVGVHDISWNGSISFCPSSVHAGCRYPCCTSPLDNPWSVHLLIDLPVLFLPSIMPKIAYFRSLASCILHMWPKKFSFLSIILCTILVLVPLLFMISVFLIFCCQFTFDSLLADERNKKSVSFKNPINSPAVREGSPEGSSSVVLIKICGCFTWKEQ